MDVIGSKSFLDHGYRVARRGKRRQERKIHPLQLEGAGNRVCPVFMRCDKFYLHCLWDGSKGMPCDHLLSSHLVAIMPMMKTTDAKTPMIAECLNAAMLSTNTMDARSPSFT